MHQNFFLNVDLNRSCDWGVGLHAHLDFSLDWLHTGRDLSGFRPRREKWKASLAEAFEFRLDSRWFKMCFPRGGRESNLNCLPQPVPIPCRCSFFFRPRGWTETSSLHSGWPCPGLLCHSWCPLAPAESSSKWPRLHLVRLDYMVKSVPVSFHVSGSWCSSAPAESSLKWPRLHLVRIDYMVKSVPGSFHLSGSWRSLAPAKYKSSLKWPRLHLVRLGYIVSPCWCTPALQEVLP